MHSRKHLRKDRQTRTRIIERCIEREALERRVFNERRAERRKALNFYRRMRAADIDSPYRRPDRVGRADWALPS